ncbi:hypothetical protein CCUS01_03048, partial [Colletotrichum cuscutae]
RGICNSSIFFLLHTSVPGEAFLRVLNRRYRCLLEYLRNYFGYAYTSTLRGCLRMCKSDDYYDTDSTSKRSLDKKESQAAAARNARSTSAHTADADCGSGMTPTTYTRANRGVGDVLMLIQVQGNRYVPAMMSLLWEAWNPTWEPRGCAQCVSVLWIRRWWPCWPRPFPPRLMMFDDLQHTYHNATRQHPVLPSRAESEPYLYLYIVICLLYPYYDIGVQPRILSFGYPYGHNTGE